MDESGSTKGGKSLRAVQRYFLITIIDSALDILVDHDHFLLDENSRAIRTATGEIPNGMGAVPSLDCLSPRPCDCDDCCGVQGQTIMQDSDLTPLFPSGSSRSRSIVIDSAADARRTSDESTRWKSR